VEPTEVPPYFWTIRDMLGEPARKRERF